MIQSEIQIPPTIAHSQKRFVGSKGGSGIAQWLISLMPPHRVYVEGFLGRGVIMRTKLPAAENIGVEIDGDTISEFEVELWKCDHLRPVLINDDCLKVIPSLNLPADALCYFDPPYPGDVRADKGRRYYRHDALGNEWHESFLTMLQALPCMVMVSGYDCELYSRRLGKWRTSYKWTVNRAGAKVREFVWMNFQEPALLHDSRFVGGDFTNRQRVKRKQARWRKNFLAMPPAERWAMYETLSAVVDAGQPEFVE